ncbi:MAG TPA: nucleotide exchange factor GrpE [Ruminococcaceae bacterium]|nr:nucleotide exchange factor GrpE [Oscillospiraceae bacterium]
MAKKKEKENPKAEVEETGAEEQADAEETAEKAAEQPKDENEEKIKALEEEIASWKDKYMRLAAEYENYRKRTSNEKLSIYDDATSKAVTEILPVSDSVRMALENLKDSDPEIVKGVELISNQLQKSFDKLKIESYGKPGDEFDPNLHNAVSMVDSDEYKSNQIANVFQTGYKIGDKIIRHAMVQVVN